MVRVWISSEPVLREMATRIDRPILASTAAKDRTTMNKGVSISDGLPRSVSRRQTVISVIASRLRRAIRKCLR